MAIVSAVLSLMLAYPTADRRTRYSALFYISSNSTTLWILTFIDVSTGHPTLALLLGGVAPVAMTFVAFFYSSSKISRISRSNPPMTPKDRITIALKVRPKTAALGILTAVVPHVDLLRLRLTKDVTSLGVQSASTMSRTRGIVVFGCVSLLPVFGYLYVTGRYLAREELARRPILYLRRFSSTRALKVFGSVIAPMLSSLFMIECLIHRTQTGTDLNMSLKTLAPARTFNTPDSEWLSWIQGRMSVAEGMIFDATGMTENDGLSLELRLASQFVDSGRILVIVSRDDTTAIELIRDMTNELQVIEYDPEDAQAIEPVIISWLQNELGFGE